ncbi:MAG: RtcB family protein [Mariprofundaceae bacterium]
MPVRMTLEASDARPVKVWTDDIDEPTQQQLRNVASLPFIHHHIAAMPDVHLGLGATIGAVIPTVDAIVPAAVGVDIGCGMVAVRTSLTARDLPDNLKAVRSGIESRVPVGFAGHARNDVRFNAVRKLERRVRAFAEQYPSLVTDKWMLQIGTLGGGNHFIEVCVDEAQRVWVMLHSGSRGFGNRIGQHFIGLAKQEMQREHIHLPDRNLAYLREGSELFSDYVQAVELAQDYARINRGEMLELIVEAMRMHLPPFKLTEEAINCHHNYVARERHFGREVWLTRKGAIRAQKGDLGIVPGSMGASSYIVRGRGNAESFCSCAHGAGRRMSRHQAKRTFSLEDMQQQTTGVECRKDKGVIDEIPAAYKDINAVMANQSDLVEVVHTLKQLLCVKG